MKRHLILVGLPGAGKSTVGRLLADRLGTHCTDIDPNIERATGLTIAELFAEEGEAAFRVREHRAVLEALVLPPHVVAPGGGWAAQSGNLAATAPRAVAVHLAVTPAEAARRLGGAGTRPLLAPDPLRRLLDLDAERRAAYQRADLAIDVTGRPAEEVADLLLDLARAKAGW